MKAGRLGFLERLMFTFMGPPQVGDVNAPAADLPPRPVRLCPRCGRPYDEHEVVRDARLTWSRCPTPEDQAGTVEQPGAASVRPSSPAGTDGL